MSDSHRFTNRLARETSPYLLQHAHNPVDWYPWGEEAFAKARAEDKPIFLSVGYATCHWCHVMERESFEDEAVAQLLNEGFVPIKVDREELPDVDHVYMSALQAMARHGGWPMNMFLTPDLKPFYGGTYFPPQPRFGMPAFADVLRAVRDAWSARRAEIEASALALLDHLREGATPPRQALGDDLHAQALAQLERRFDAAHGGFGDAPKFPQAPLLQYLLALAACGDDRARSMLVATLAQMAAGGIYDHVGGGFARYSTDARWHVPHFEKMLYDNAQLVRVYVGTYRLIGDERLRFVAEDTLAW
ncbi:MAG: thioredoxin domain-containing protein, partial [Pseudomonadota bacterium]